VKSRKPTKCPGAQPIVCDLFVGGEVVVTTDVIGAVLQDEPHSIIAQSARGEYLSLQQRRLMRVAMTVMLDTIYPRNRDCFGWLMSFLSHGVLSQGNKQIVT
jgi:hypothetical protein